MNGQDRKIDFRLTLGLFFVVWLSTVGLLLYMVEPPDRPPTFALTVCVILGLEALAFAYFTALASTRFSGRVDPALWPSIGMVVGAYSLIASITVLMHNLAYVHGVREISEGRALPIVFIRAAFVKLAPMATALPFLGQPKWLVFALVVETVGFLVCVRGLLAVQTIRSAEAAKEPTRTATVLLEVRAKELQHNIEGLRSGLDRQAFENIHHKVIRLVERFQFSRRFASPTGDLENVEQEISASIEELCRRSQGDRLVAVPDPKVLARDLDSMLTNALRLMDVREKLQIR